MRCNPAVARYVAFVVVVVDAADLCYVSQDYFPHSQYPSCVVCISQLFKTGRDEDAPAEAMSLATIASAMSTVLSSADTEGSHKRRKLDTYTLISRQTLPQSGIFPSARALLDPACLQACARLVAAEGRLKERLNMLAHRGQVEVEAGGQRYKKRLAEASVGSQLAVPFEPAAALPLRVMKPWKWQ